MNLPEQNIEACILKFILSLYLFNSKYPIDKIQETIDNLNSENITLNNQSSFAIIAPPKNSVITLWVSEDYFLFCAYLKNQFTLKLIARK